MGAAARLARRGCRAACVLEGVKRASRDWVANDKDEGWLTHATSRLQAAERLQGRPDLAASLQQIDRDYLAACREREEAVVAESRAARMRKRRLQLALIAALILVSLAGVAHAFWVNFDYLKVRGEMMADNLLPKALAAETERSLSQMVLEPGQHISFRECNRC